MANPKHLKILKQGVEVWNKWRVENADERPDLSGAGLGGAKLIEAMLIEADLTGADLLIGVSPQTLRRWEREGDLLPDRRSEGATRYYDLDRLFGLREVETDLTVAYARVSSQEQREDLSRQVERLEMYCAAKGWSYEIIRDLGSRMNYRKKGLKRLVEMILNGVRPASKDGGGPSTWLGLQLQPWP